MQTKTLKQYSTLVCAVALTCFSVLLSSCGDDEAAPKPVADFTHVVDEATGLKVTFTNTSENGVTYSWNFGVTGATSTVESPEYTYAASGAYTVVLTATGKDGSTATKTKTIPLTAVPQNVLVNEDFVNADNWRTLYVFGADIASIFNNGITLTTAEADNQAGLHIYQEVVLQPGTYEIAMELDVDAAQANAWAEVYFTSAPPVEGEELADEDKIIGFNSFGDCSETAFAGDVKTVDAGCLEGVDIENGQITITETTTRYFVIYTGVYDGTYGGNFAIKSVGLTKIL